MPLSPDIAGSGSSFKGTPQRFYSVTEMTPPDLTEGDRKIVRKLLEGVIRNEFQKIDDVIKEQLSICGWILTPEERIRLEEILEIVEWNVWRGQFRVWLAKGKWF